MLVMHVTRLPRDHSICILYWYSSGNMVPHRETSYTGATYRYMYSLFPRTTKLPLNLAGCNSLCFCH